MLHGGTYERRAMGDLPRLARGQARGGWGVSGDPTATIVHLYEDEQMSLSAVAKRVHKGNNAVKKILRCAGVRKRTGAEQLRITYERREKVHFATICRMYVEERKNLREIEEATGIHYGVCERLLVNAGITIRPKLEQGRITKAKHEEQDNDGETCQRCGIVLVKSGTTTEEGAAIHANDEPDAGICWRCREELVIGTEAEQGREWQTA